MIGLLVFLIAFIPMLYFSLLIYTICTHPELIEEKQSDL